MTSSVSKQEQSTLAKLDQTPNSPIQLRLNLGSLSKTMQGEYIGVQHYDFFMVRINSFPGVLNALLPNTVVDVRFQDDGTIQSFRTELIAHITRPALILFLRYPERVSILKLRKSPRLSCTLPARIQTPLGNGEGLISNIGDSGCQIHLPLMGNSYLRSLEKETNIIIQVQLLIDRPADSCTATIKRIEEIRQKVTIGVAFFDMSPAFEKNLSDYVLFVKELKK